MYMLMLHDVPVYQYQLISDDIDLVLDLIQ